MYPIRHIIWPTSFTSHHKKKHTHTHTHTHLSIPVEINLSLCRRSQSIGSANLDQHPSRSPRLTPNSQYSPSTAGYYTYSSTPPPPRGRKTSYAGHEAGSSATLTLPPSQSPGSPWKRKLSKTMKNFMGSPRFHRRRMDCKISYDIHVKWLKYERSVPFFVYNEKLTWLNTSVNSQPHSYMHVYVYIFVY